MKFQSKLKLFHQRKRMSKCGLPNGGHVAQGGCSTHDQGQGHSSQPATMPNRPISQIPQCTSPISHNASFCNRNVHMCAHFCYKMVHCGISLIHCGICEMGLFTDSIPNTQQGQTVDGTSHQRKNFCTHPSSSNGNIQDFYNRCKFVPQILWLK